MAGVRELRAAIAQVLAIDPFTTVTYMQFPPIPPMIEIFPKRSMYDEGFSTDEIRFTVRATASSTISSAAQDLLDRLIDATGPDSVKALLEASDRGQVLVDQDETLEGFVNDVRVEEHSDYHLYPVGDGGHILGIELTVCVLTTRPTDL